MRSEKQSIVSELKQCLQGSPYVILADFTGLNVDGFAQLRGRLAKVNARAMVTKNSFLRLALKELGWSTADTAFEGPTAMVFGGKEISAAAGVLKGFFKDFKKLKVKAGVMDRAALSLEEVEMLADLPPREVMQAQLLGLLMAPANSLARLLNTPASQFAQVLQAKAQKAA
jgi:large subunit ribosomal protein L10